MWTRKELKERAKAALKRNYWKAVLVSLLLIMLGGGISPATAAGGSSDDYDYEQEIPVTESETETSTAAATVADTVKEAVEGVEEGLKQVSDTALAAYMVVFFVVIIVIVIIAMAIIIIVDVFLGNPLCVGAHRFMLKSVDDKGNIAELGYAFDHNYKNVVKTTFFRDLQIGLWLLLFIIPGIYKKYQYYMVDYILAENPDMPYKEVLERSKKMMDGQKWKTFILEASFILWHMLSMLTCGLSEIFYVSPYVYLTRASLYRVISTQGEERF